VPKSLSNAMTGRMTPRIQDYNILLFFA
jgi:hypothetical protein